MLPTVQLGNASIPGDTNEHLVLTRRGDEYSIRIDGTGELMNSRQHSSEDALASLAIDTLRAGRDVRILIGGLGMGFTLAAALAEVSDNSQVDVAELIPEVVEWNRGELGACAGNPLQDARTHVTTGDVAAAIRKARGLYDAILLDVDNGPEGLTHGNNNWLYSPKGLAGIHRALRPHGVLSVWSASADPVFPQRLKQAGYKVTEEMVRAHKGKGARHTIWLGQRRN